MTEELMMVDEPWQLWKNVINILEKFISKVKIQGGKSKGE